VSYTDIFGGKEISPAQLSYAYYPISSDFYLVWPFEALDGANVAFDKMDILASASGLKLYMPNAELVSVGEDALINNVGANAFTVVDYTGTVICAPLPGQQWYIYLTDNGTTGGTWRAVQFGAGTSPINAGSLAGFGLRARGNQLDQNVPTTTLVVGTTLGENDRAQVIRSTGGAVSYGIARATTLGNGWFTTVINSGTGTLTLAPTGGDRIDGQLTKLLSPGENCIVYSDGFGFWTVGYGRIISNTASAINVNIAGAGAYTLSAVELASQVQNFSGTLTADRVVDYGATQGFWFVFNNTNGAHTVTYRASSPDPGAVVPQGTFSILRSDGASLDIAFTATSGTVTQINTAAGELTGGPINSTGTIGLANTAVSPGTYGDANSVGVFQVDQKGRVVAASNVDIQIATSQVTGLDALIAAAVNRAVPIGTIIILHSATLGAGYLYANGQTIGNAASNASARANADVSLLFETLWNADINLVIYTSAGGVTSRGASAAADFAANKALALPDLRDRAVIGVGNMGGAAAAGRVTPAGGGINTLSLGTSGGDQFLQTHTHAISDVTHNHVLSDPGHTHGIPQGGRTGNNAGLGGVGGGNQLWDAGPAATGTNVGFTGMYSNPSGTGITGTLGAGSGGSQNVQPSIVSNYAIRYA
jgi:hypothetical protein